MNIVLIIVCIGLSINIDHTPFIDGTQIYITASLYDFDEYAYKGKGLDLYKRQDDDEQFN